MADKSKIEWTDASWNPIRAVDLHTGKIGWHCEHATTGCINCYSECMNRRLGTGLPFKPGHRSHVKIFLDDNALLLPLRWQKPRMIFVCSMTDAFADFVTDEMLDKMFAVMALCPQHTFQILTKRAERMSHYLAGGGGASVQQIVDMQFEASANGVRYTPNPNLIFPLPNVWLGVSCERQEEADERIPHLLQTPAAIRFVSAEPLLGLIDLIGTLARWQDNPNRDRRYVRLGEQLINWVIVGGESGPAARPMHPAWARSLRDECAAAGIAFFFKQWGEWAPFYYRDDGFPKRTFAFDDGVTVYRIGKKTAAHFLDNREHREFPAAPAERQAA